MSEPTVVGLQPWLPWPLRSMPWWTEPVRAERLAALRIGVGAVLLLDALGHYLPYASVFLGSGSLGGSEVFPAQGGQWFFKWSLVREIGPSWLMQAVLLVWAGCGLALVLGLWSRFCAAVAWVLGVSLFNANPYLINSGDCVRDILLFYLMLSPCGVVWSFSPRPRFGGEGSGARGISPLQGLPPHPQPLAPEAGARGEDRLRPLSPEAGARGEKAVFIPPWPLRLLFVQMALIYFVGGAYKALFPAWRDGSAMYDHLTNLAWTRMPYEWIPLPQLVVPLFTWITLIWELGFPVLVCLRPTRAVTLWLGVLFHLGTVLAFQIGPFPFYMLCFYLPLVPWERYGRSEMTDPSSRKL